MILNKVFFVFYLTKIIFSLDNPEEKKLNVVLFLAKPPDGQLFDNTGLKFLNFEEKARVKHCADNEKSNSNNLQDQSRILGALSTPEIDCKALLKAGIISLISYCRNVMGMTTAIASLDNDTFTNGLRFKRSQLEDLEIIYVNPKKIKIRDIDVPMYNLFPPKRKMRFNNINKWSRDKEIITEPEHTEIFKIRSKRGVKPIARNSLEMNRDKLNNPKWDILGIIGTLKLTFFGKLLEDSNENEDVKVNQEQGPASIGEVYENPLFDIVKQTLSNVQEACESGFLIIVVGGCLKEISDPYSSLVQSIKHVTENTDDDNTLIVVTGYCPKSCDLDDKVLIPVYVRGPATCSGIAISTELYDIPYAIKNVISDTNIGGSFVSKVSPKRSKREAVTPSKNKSSPSDKPSVPHYFLILLWSILLRINLRHSFDI